MKINTLIAAILLFTAALFAQQDKNYIITVNDTEIGAYLSLGGRYSTALAADPAGFLDFKGALVFNGKWAVGLMGSGLYYDKKLSQLVNDGTYHLMVSYGGLFVERIFPLNDNLRLSAAIASGAGEAYYQYDRDYRDEKIWTEEIIDKSVFFIFEPSVEIQHRIAGNWWIGVNASYRNTSPLELYKTDKDILRKFSAGISFKWGIF